MTGSGSGAHAAYTQVKQSESKYNLSRIINVDYTIFINKSYNSSQLLDIEK